MPANRALFLKYLSLKSEEVPLPAALEQRLEYRINSWSDNRWPHSSRQHRKWYWISGWAAALILTIGIGFHQTKIHITVEMQDTCETPEQTYAKTRHTLKTIVQVWRKAKANCKKPTRPTGKLKKCYTQ